MRKLEKLKEEYIMKNVHTIKATVLNGNPDFVIGRMVGVIDAIVGPGAFVEPVDVEENNATFVIEVTEEQFLAICEKFNMLFTERRALVSFAF
jgi:hypothetical protein